MSPLKTAIMVALVSGLLTSAWQYRQQSGRAKEAAHLRTENDRLRLQASQRHEAQVLRTRNASVSATKTNSSTALPTSAPAAMPAKGRAEAESNYRNEGQVTPVAAMQSLAWACDHGDTALMEKLIIFDRTARDKAEKYFASLPEGMPSQWASLEAMAAALYVADGMEHPYPVAEVLRLAKFEAVGPGRVTLRLPGGNGDGYEFQQTPDGWKLAVTEAVVDDYIKRNQPPARNAH